MRGRLSLRSLLILLTALGSLLTVVVLGVVVQWLLAVTTRDTVDQVLNDRAEALVSSVVEESTGRRIEVPAARLDADVAVYDGSGRLRAGAVPDALAPEYAALRTTASDRSTTVRDYARVRASRFATGGGARGTVVMSERLAPYRQDARFTLWTTLGAGLLIVGGSTALVAYVSRRVLAPVGTMARTAADWSEHDLGRRFDLPGRGNEITDLGHTLDALLDKVAHAIRSEQRLTSELAHELRTPLAGIRGNADLLSMNTSLDEVAREDLDDILTACDRMSTTITSLVDLARSGADATGSDACPVADVVADVLAELALPHVRPDLRLRLDLDPEAGWSVPPALAARALAPLVANASRHASTEVLVSSVPAGDPRQVAVAVSDDGPGIDAGIRDDLFVPGRTTGEGAGLGLALARRIARANGGDVVLAEAGLAIFVLSLPGL